MHIDPASLRAWLALYSAASILALVCASLAAIKTGIELRSGNLNIPLRRWRDRLLAAPRLWVAWQLNYLRGAPVVIAICIYFAWYLGFSRLGNI